MRANLEEPMMRIACSFALALGLAACGSSSSSPTQPEAAAPAAPATQCTPGDLAIAGGGPCGTSYCTKRQFCCNLSCSTCAPLGGACTQQVCTSPTVVAPTIYF